MLEGVEVRGGAGAGHGSKDRRSRRGKPSTSGQVSETVNPRTQTAPEVPMHKRLILAYALTAAVALSASASAQDTRVYRTEPGGVGRAFSFGFEEDYDRAVVGITTSSGSARDTLG